MALILAKADYFPSEAMPVAVADRAPQPSSRRIAMNSAKSSLSGAATACMYSTTAPAGNLR